MNQTVVCYTCGKVTERDHEGRLYQPWQWRYTLSYGNRFVPRSQWERYWFCSDECAKPFDLEAASTAFA